MYQGFISIKSVLDRVYRNPLMTDLPFESALVWTADVIRLIGSPAFLQRKIIRLGIEGYRCTKPLDIVFVQQVRRVIIPYSSQTTWTFMDSAVQPINGDYENVPYPEPLVPSLNPPNTNSVNVEFAPVSSGEEYRAMYEATDAFHEFYKNSDMSGIAPTESYRFNGNYIYCSFEEGTVDIAYDGIMVDDDGFPMIPNDPSVEKAIENYIKKEYLGIMSDLGKDVVRALNRAEVEYCWNIGQSQSHAAMMSLDRRESLSNTMNRLMLNGKEHDSMWRNVGYPEKIKKQ